LVGRRVGFRLGTVRCMMGVVCVRGGATRGWLTGRHG
jgi:hypothetical protein